MNINDSADSGINIDAVSGLNLVSLFMDSNGAQAEGGAMQDSGIHIEDLIGDQQHDLKLDDPEYPQHEPRLGPEQQFEHQHADGDQHEPEPCRGRRRQPGQRGINLVATGTANVKLVVSGGQIVNNAAAGILVTGGSGTTVRTDISSVDLVQLGTSG